MSGCYFKKGLFIHFRVCGVFFYILSTTDRSEVQIDSKEGCLTLWCHQPHPGQSLKPQTVVEFQGQEVESGWIFKKSFELGDSKTQPYAGLSGQVSSFKT